MYKFPENKIPPYNLCKKDKKIIEASINLGRFLLSLPECNFRQKKDIKRMLHFLTRLPLAPPKDFNRELYLPPPPREFCAPRPSDTTSNTVLS